MSIWWSLITVSRGRDRLRCPHKLAVMDTNDPALAVVAGRGADVTVVPMDDNSPLNAYRRLDVVPKSPWEVERSDYFGAIAVEHLVLDDVFDERRVLLGLAETGRERDLFAQRDRGRLRGGRPSSGYRRCRGLWS